MGLKETQAILDNDPAVLRMRGNAEADALRTHLQELGVPAEVRQVSDLPSVSEAAATGSANGSIAGELERLAELYRTGALNDDEFAAAKRKLLGT